MYGRSKITCLPTVLKCSKPLGSYLDGEESGENVTVVYNLPIYFDYIFNVSGGQALKTVVSGLKDLDF